MERESKMPAPDIARRARDTLRLMAQRVQRLRYAMPGSAYRRMSAADAAAFQPELDVWRPPDALPGVMLRWFMTEWCNYDCPYCTQTHRRDAPKGRGKTAHAFDNFPIEAWQDAIVRHFGTTRLAVLITGGEPFVDRKAMVPFLNFLTKLPATESIRIDTNGWWAPEPYAALDKSKITLMCTLHPSQTTVDRFLKRIDALLAAGFHVGMVNYVMNADNLPHYLDYKEELRHRRIPLHPNPLWNSTGDYAPEDLEILRGELEDADFQYRSGSLSPLGKKCLFPALAYELDYLGNIYVGCHAPASGNFFDKTLPPLFAGPVPCPHKSCVCLDKYSFVEGMGRNLSLDPLRTYGEILRNRRRLSNG
jgi:MoaA/NifB/PqqE/SkfB family radical SAM enzyme